MTFIGNALLVIGSLLLLAVGRLQLTAMPGGDRGVGHAWAVLMSNGALLLVMVALSAVVAFSNRLPVLPLVNTPRSLAAIGFVLVASIVAAIIVVESPSGAPKMWSVDMVLRLLPLLVPLCIMISAAILLNRPSATGMTSPVVTFSIGAVALCTIGFGAVAAVPYVANRARSSMAVASRAAGAMDSNQQRILADVEAADSVTGWMTFVQFASAGQHSTIRERAVERLMAVPDWEAKVIEGLSSARSREIMGFLVANDVPNPEQFAAPLVNGIRQQALEVRDRIRRSNHPSNLYEGLMVFETEDVLQAVRKFEKYGVDYAPALREMRAAFDEPKYDTKIEYRGAKAIDKWLDKHR